MVLSLNYFHHNSRCKTFHEKKWLWKWIKQKYNMAGQCGCFVSFGCCFVVVLFFFLSYILPQRIRVSRVCTRYVFQHNESCTFVVLLQRCLLPDMFRFTQKGCVFETLWFWGNMLQQALWLHSNIPFLHLRRWTELKSLSASILDTS